MPEEDIEHKGVMPQLIATFKADILEELADKLKIRDKNAFIETVRQYNVMAEAGKDTVFGVPPKDELACGKDPGVIAKMWHQVYKKNFDGEQEADFNEICRT